MHIKQKEQVRGCEPVLPFLLVNTVIENGGSAAAMVPGLLVLALAGGFGLLLAAHGRLFISLTLTHLGKDTTAGSAALETAQGALKGFALFDTDLRHLFPSLGLRQEFAGQSLSINQ